MAFWNCQVTRVGPASGDSVYITLKEKDGKFWCWFKAPNAEKKEMLAVALAALTSGYSVDVGIDGPDGVAPPENSVILNFYLNKFG